MIEHTASPIKNEEPHFLRVYNGRSQIIIRGYGKDNNGIPLHGQWCLYDIKSGELLDRDTLRNDLLERQEFYTRAM